MVNLEGKGLGGEVKRAIAWADQSRGDELALTLERYWNKTSRGIQSLTFAWWELL